MNHNVVEKTLPQIDPMDMIAPPLRTRKECQLGGVDEPSTQRRQVDPPAKSIHDRIGEPLLARSEGRQNIRPLLVNCSCSPTLVFGMFRMFILFSTIANSSKFMYPLQNQYAQTCSDTKLRTGLHTEHVSLNSLIVGETDKDERVVNPC